MGKLVEEGKQGKNAAVYSAKRPEPISQGGI